MDKNKKSILILGANGFIGNALLNDLCNDGIMKVYGMDVENNKLVNSYGVARVRCAGCGHDFFVAFSCRARGVCPSYTSKRSLLFGEKVREIYETDPLTCSECGEPMRIITTPLEVAKILEHIGEQTSRAPPLTLTDPVPSFCDFGDTNFQYPEVPWYPDPPAPDF